MDAKHNLSELYYNYIKHIPTFFETIKIESEDGKNCQ